MKTEFYQIFVAFFLVGLVVTNCKKDENNELIEENGLSRDINDLIPEDIFDILDSLGMPINTGGNPADIEDAFFISPVILLESNRENDIIGKQYSDGTVVFSEQNNEELTIITNVNYENREGEGYGSFISGTENNITVFAKIKTYDTETNDSTLSTQIFSGTLNADGIEDLYMALVMLNDYGDPNDKYIEVGDARIFYDEDGFSERVDDEKSVDINLPSLPYFSD